MRLFEILQAQLRRHAEQPADVMAKAPTIKGVSSADVSGKRVSAYFNLHNKHWSLKSRDTGTVMGHSKHVVVQGAQFHVGEAGRQRVIREGQKNVHAFVRGTAEHVEPHAPPAHAVLVSYNPYKAGHFYRKDTGAPVHEADTVHMTPHGVYAVNPRSTGPKPSRFVLTEGDVTTGAGTVAKAYDGPFGASAFSTFHYTAHDPQAERLARHADQQFAVPASATTPLHPNMLIRHAVDHYKNNSTQPNELIRGKHWEHSPYEALAQNPHDLAHFRRTFVAGAQRAHRVVHVLDHALHQSHLPEHTVLHRGVSGKLGEKLNDLHARGKLHDSVIHDPAFWSTTTDERVAQRFASQHPHHVMLHIHAEKGTLGAHVENLHTTSGMKHESEVILPRGRQLRVHNAYHQDGVLHVHGILDNAHEPAPALKLHRKYKKLLGKNFDDPAHEDYKHDLFSVHETPADPHVANAVRGLLSRGKKRAPAPSAA